MLDFPSSPSVSQKYPASPIAGVPTYTWDGEKWTTVGSPPATQPIYADGSVAMTGQLNLIAPPTAAAHAAAKSYVDSRDARETVYSAQQSFAVATLVDGPTIDWAVNIKQKAKVQLAGNRTMNAPTGMVEGTTYFLWVFQDPVGSKTLTFPAGSFDFGAVTYSLSTLAGRGDLMTFEAMNIAGTLKMRLTGIVKGYA
jgi:hypothetical protein